MPEEEAFVMSLNGRPRSRLWRTGTVPLTQHTRARSHERQSQPLRPAVLSSRHEGGLVLWRVFQEQRFRSTLEARTACSSPARTVPPTAGSHTAVSSSLRLGLCVSTALFMYVCAALALVAETPCHPNDRSAYCRKKLCCRSPLSRDSFCCFPHHTKVKDARAARPSVLDLV